LNSRAQGELTDKMVQNPQGEPSLAQDYAARDDAEGGDIHAWRTEIDRLLAAGPPYGKVGPISDETKDDFEQWRLALEVVPKNASRLEVYECASVGALLFLGY